MVREDASEASAPGSASRSGEGRREARRDPASRGGDPGELCSTGRGGTPRGLDVVVLAGLQGSGKTTFHAARFAATHDHVSRDLFRNARDPRARQRALVEAAARAGRSVVVDNTNARREDRVELVALAHALGMRAVLYWFPPDVRESLARNARRAGRARVPAVAVLATAKRLAPPEPSEGFDLAYEVRPVPGAFEIAARPDLTRAAPR